VDRQQLLKRLDSAWTAFKASYAGLSDRQMLEPGVSGKWSVRDIIAHVTSWEEEALKYLPLILKGGRPPRYSGGIDGFNALATEQRKALPLSEVLHQLDETHNRLIELLETVPDDRFAGESRFRRRLRLDTYSHYPEHTKAIQQWRRRLG
jgi:hypothetical protein